MSEEKKQRLKEYQKGYRVAKKSQSNQENSFDLCWLKQTDGDKSLIMHA